MSQVDIHDLIKQTYHNYIRRNTKNSVLWSRLLEKLILFVELRKKLAIAVIILLVITLLGGVGAEAFAPERYKPSTIINRVYEKLTPKQVVNQDSLITNRNRIELDNLYKLVDEAVKADVVTIDISPFEQSSQVIETPVASESSNNQGFNWQQYDHGPKFVSNLTHPYFTKFQMTVPSGWTTEIKSIPSTRFGGFYNYAFIMRKQDITVTLYAQPGYIGMPFDYGDLIDEPGGWGHTNIAVLPNGYRKALMSKSSPQPTTGEQTVVYGGSSVGSIFPMDSTFSFAGPEINVNTEKNTYRVFVSVNQNGASPFLDQSLLQFTYTDNTIATNHPLLPEIDTMIGSISNCFEYMTGPICTE